MDKQLQPVKDLVGGFLKVCDSVGEKLSNVDLKVKIGEFEPRASVKLSYSSTNYEADQARTDVEATSDDIVGIIAFEITNECDTSKISELINSLLGPVVSNLPFKFTAKPGYHPNGTRIFQLIFSIDDKMLNIKEPISKALDLAKIQNGEFITLDFSHSTSDSLGSDSAHGAMKASARIHTKASRDFVRSVVNMILTGQTDDAALGLLGMISGFKNFEFNLEFDDVEEAMKKFTPLLFDKKTGDDWSLEWEEIKYSMVCPLVLFGLLELSKIMGSGDDGGEFDAEDPEQIRKKIPGFYATLRDSVVGMSHVQIVFGNHILKLSFDGLNVVKDLFPDVGEDSEDLKKTIEKKKSSSGLTLGHLLPKNECRVLMLGLDAGGKTTLLYKLKLGEVVTTIPTIGFNCETIKYKRMEFTFWDVGGQKRIRALWRHYLQNTQLVVFVVDCNDRERIEEAKEELHKLLAEDDLVDAALLVIANKQDLPNAMTVAETTDKLGLHSLRNRQWYIQACCAVTGDGLYEGLDWAHGAVNK